MEEFTCFKAYDIRGKLGTELNNDVAYRIGRAFGFFLSPSGDLSKSVVIGGDTRLSSESLKESISAGIRDSGVNVIDLGVTGTEEIYFATKDMEVDGGIEVTASHNPINYNGMKIVAKGAQPIGIKSGLGTIKNLAENGSFPPIKFRGTKTTTSHLSRYMDHLLTYVVPSNIKPMKLVVNAGNGAAGHVVDELEKVFRDRVIPITFIKIHNNPDGTFPNGIPNPLLPECREDTSLAVKKHGADFGIAWDGDFDRCFLFDEHGEFIEGYYIVGLLAEAFLQKNRDSKIIHDSRLYWNTLDIVSDNGGVPILSKAGHVFIKEKMREEDAVYGGEMSAHHYFRDFAYCDSGMIPWLLVAELISLKNKSLSSLLSERINKYPSSGEINIKVDNSKLVIENVLNALSSKAYAIDTTDGIDMDMGTWRFNLRFSNTEPLLRLNVESRGCVELLNSNVQLLLNLIGRL